MIFAIVGASWGSYTQYLQSISCFIAIVDLAARSFKSIPAGVEPEPIAGSLVLPQAKLLTWGKSALPGG
jgi:hypothetical protein